MRKIVSSIIMSLDNFVASADGGMNMFKVDQEFFDMSATLCEAADTALYGKGTYQIMQAYWPTAGDKPGASAHDEQHAAWYKHVKKYVLSKTLKSADAPGAFIIRENVVEELKKLKEQEGKNIQIFGSPGVVRSLTQQGLIDEYWIFVFPVILGNGIPLFKDIKQQIDLIFVSGKFLTSGAVVLHYIKENKKKL
jgi:dihydrofolate reductase